MSLRTLDDLRAVPGTGASATAGISAGQVTSLTVSNPGKGYVFGAPSIIFSGGGGSGATGTAQVDADGYVTGLVITSAGSGYSSAPSVSFTPVSPIPSGQTILMEGYGFPGDGGGGWFYFLQSDNYSTDNGGTLIVPGGAIGTLATAGCWHRDGPGTQGASAVPATTLDVRWFGAIPNEANDATPGIKRAFDALKFAGVQQSGTLYIPAGRYKLGTKCVLDGGNAWGFSIKGDGAGSTILNYGLASADTCALEIKGVVVGGIQDLSFRYVNYPTANSPSVLYIHDNVYYSVINVKGVDLVSTNQSGGVVHCANNTNLQLIGLNFGGNGSGGTSLYWESGSGLVNNCVFLTANTDAPCWRMANCNSIQIVNSFFQGGGPWKHFAGATITSTATNFTITQTAHGFRAGDYVVLLGGSKPGYNTWWRIASVTTNTLTIDFSGNLGPDTVVLDSLWSCAYFGSPGGNVTESFLSDCLFNTGGAPGAGSVGLFLDGYQGNNVGEISVQNCLFDYGMCAVFVHGATNSDPSSTCGGISLNNCRPNGGPRDHFGCFRLEGVTKVTIDGTRMFPGNNNPPGTGKIFNCVVISDGGQAYPTQDIVITGGSFSHQNSSGLYPNVTAINAFVFDGPNVKRIRIMNPGVDTTHAFCHVADFQNGAATSNGISILYSDDGGNLLHLGAGGNQQLQAINSGNFGLFGGIQNQYFFQLDPIGYPTGGNIQIRFDIGAYAAIGLTVPASFSPSGSYGMNGGRFQNLDLTNTTGGSLALTWPGTWKLANGALPTSLAAGQTIRVLLACGGTTESSIIASLFK